MQGHGSAGHSRLQDEAVPQSWISGALRMGTFTTELARLYTGFDFPWTTSRWQTFPVNELREQLARMRGNIASMVLQTPTSRRVHRARIASPEARPSAGIARVMRDGEHPARRHRRRRNRRMDDRGGAGVFLPRLPDRRITLIESTRSERWESVRRRCQIRALQCQPWH
jgi:hypothetical protein